MSVLANEMFQDSVFANALSCGLTLQTTNDIFAFTRIGAQVRCSFGDCYLSPARSFSFIPMDSPRCMKCAELAAHVNALRDARALFAVCKRFHTMLEMRSWHQECLAASWEAYRSDSDFFCCICDLPPPTFVLTVTHSHPSHS